ncbi:MAG: tetratricopeptide repeat protein [Alphaproteobacteria bacterium]|nr:tetratricopeptide repeat protein [Alphaproteobacteria bacterium]
MTVNPQDLLESALHDARAERFTAAEKTLRLLLSEPLNQQDRAAVQGLLGAVCASLGDHPAAVEELESAAAALPDDASIAANLSVSLREVGRLDDAIAAGKKATALHPQFAEAHCNLGVALRTKGDLAGAAVSYRRALQVRPDFAEAHNNLGIVLRDMGELEDAITSYRRALELRPDYAEAHNNLGVALKDKGACDDAVAAYRRALELRPDYAEAHNNLGVALKDKGACDDAVAAYQRALELRPGYAEAHNNLGVALLDRGDAEDAAASFQRALELRPGYAEAHSNLGIAFKDLGRLEDAIASYLDALRAKPDLAEAHDNLCELYERTNKVPEFEKALANAQRVLKEDSPKILLRRAQLASRKERFEEAISDLEKIRAEDFNPQFRSIYLVLLGKTYDRLQRFDDAFSAFCAVNELAEASPQYQRFDPDKFLDAVLSRRDSWRSGTAPAWTVPEAGPAEPSLTFLVGFPRSGTTLLDTILRGHPEISVVEEMPMVDTMRAAFGRPETVDSLNRLSEGDIEQLRATYAQELDRQIPPSQRRKVVVDKYPLNITSVGLIHRVFPKAKYIFIERHPCDCVLSCFIQNFDANDAMANFLSLERTATLYDAVMGLWQAYRSRLDLEVHELRYEALVHDLEDACRPLIDFLGLEWNDNVLNYRETALNRETIKTPSYNQVIKPLYSQAIGRWKNYEDKFAPVLPILKPWIEAFGYED